MKAICSFILALAVSSAGAQIRPVESLPIAVNYSKTIHLVFPSAVKYNQAVTDFVAVDNPESVPNILRIKANRKSFSKQTTVSVATEGGFFYSFNGKYSINSLVYWVTYVHNVVYSFYRSMIYCYINSTQRCAGSIVIDIIPTNGADKRKFFPFAPYFPVTNVIKRYFYPYFPAIIGIKGYSFPYFPYLSGIMKIKTALYSLFSRLDWHKTVVFPCLGEIYEGIRSLSWEIPVT